MKKTRLIFLLFLSLSLLILPACATEPTQQAPLTFSLLYNENAATPFQEDWLILQEYEQRKNVTFDVTLGDDADYLSSVTKVFQTGEIPDIILKVWPEQIEDYAIDGLLLPTSDYADQMPYFNAYIEEHGLEAELDKLRLPNGKFYILPGYQRQIQVQQWIYRRDLFEQHGLGVPATYDELFDDLMVLKDEYPDSTPMTAIWGGAHLMAMMGAGYEIPAGWNGVRGYNEQTDRWEFAPATDNYKAMHQFLNRCYEAGILDPDSFTQPDEEFYNKLLEGRGLVTVTWITSGFSNWNATLAENGQVGGEWAPLPVPESTIGVTALPAVDPFRKGLVISAAAAEKPYFEELLAFVDWAVYSKAGRTLTAWGVEGTTFENTADGKKFVDEIKTPKNPNGTIDMTAEYGLNTLFNLVENEEYEDDKKPEEIVAFLERSLAAHETAPMDPPLLLDENAIESTRAIEENLWTYMNDTSMAFITGEIDIDTGWDAYLQELEDRGYLTLEEIWNSAWQEQAGN